VAVGRLGAAPLGRAALAGRKVRPANACPGKAFLIGGY